MLRRTLLALFAAVLLFLAVQQGPRAYYMIRYREYQSYSFGPGGEHELRYWWPRDESRPLEYSIWFDDGRVVRSGGGSPPIAFRRTHGPHTYCFWFPGNAGGPDIVSRGEPSPDEFRAVLEQRRRDYPEYQWNLMDPDFGSPR